MYVLLRSASRPMAYNYCAVAVVAVVDVVESVCC